MMATLINALKMKGARGVFLDMSSENKRAFHFYRKLEFVELTRVLDGNIVDASCTTQHTIVLGKTLG